MSIPRVKHLPPFCSPSDVPSRTKTHSVTSTATATVTTTTTSTTLPTISNCVAPEVKISKRDKPKYKPTSHGCWETITISRVSTLTTTVSAGSLRMDAAMQGLKESHANNNTS